MAPGLRLSRSHKVLGALIALGGAFVGCQQLLGLEPGELRTTTATGGTSAGGGGSGAAGAQGGLGGTAPYPWEHLTDGLTDLGYIATDGVNAYWTGQTDGYVRWAPVDSGASPAFTVADSQKGTVGIAVDNGHVYWAAEDLGQVGYAPTDGGPPAIFWAGDAASSEPFGLAVSSGYVVWSDLLSPPNVKIRVAQAPNSSPVDLATGQSGAKLVAADSAFAYWYDEHSGSLMRARLDHSTGPEEIRQYEPVGENSEHVALAVWDVDVNNTWVFWTFPATEADADAGIVNDGKIYAARVQDPAQRQTLASGQVRPRAIAVDATYVYWGNAGSTDGHHGFIFRCARTCGAESDQPVVLANHQVQPNGIALDTDYVYWTNQGTEGNQDGSVYRVRKVAPQ